MHYPLEFRHLSLSQAVQMTLYISGTTTRPSPGPPFPTESVVWFVVFYLQVVAADVIIVRPLSTVQSPLAVTDGARRQVY